MKVCLWYIAPSDCMHLAESPSFYLTVLTQTGEAKSKPKASVSVTAAKNSVFEMWAAMDRDSQRPLAKRQLSDESRACTTRATKKTMVREEERTVRTDRSEEVQSSNCHSASQQQEHTENLTTLTRKLQKQLISHGDFCRVDTHAIKSGKEVRERGVTIGCGDCDNELR